jgi:N-(2-amino-2-carboxyethyl)-L-glutamate synthase
MRQGILSTIGETPLVLLQRALGALHFQLYAKLEGLNPGGSIKDRAAFLIVKHALDEGRLKPGMTVIESSSGNMGIGLAQACAYYGMRFICVVDPKTTKQNISILEAYGAEVDLVAKPDPKTGEYLQARLDRVQALLKLIPNSYWSDQYSNRFNSNAHHQTMREIVTALDGRVDYLFCATSTCGTLRGCAEYVGTHGLKTKIVAVDAIGSIIFGGHKAKRLIPGHGAAVRPALFQPGLATECIHVSDLDCIVSCRRLVEREAILSGGSSGAVLSAVEKMQPHIPPGANCVAIFADRGERYLETIYSDAWVWEHFGDVSVRRQPSLASPLLREVSAASSIR